MLDVKYFLHTCSHVTQRTVSISGRGMGRHVNCIDTRLVLGGLLEGFEKHPVKGLNEGDELQGMIVKKADGSCVGVFGSDMNDWCKLESGRLVFDDGIELKAVYVLGPRVCSCCDNKLGVFPT